jgi:small subunit ribosomal protein S18
MAFGAKKSGGGGRGRGGNGRSGGASGDRAGAGGQRRSLFRRRKVCKFCADKIDDINYKDVKLLSGFVPERAKVLPRRISGTCAKHQRKLRVAIMRARVLALLPYSAD